MGKFYNKNKLALGGYQMKFYKYTGYCQGARGKELHVFFYENANGISNRMGGNNKLSKAKDLIDKLGADIVAYNKHRQNLHHIDHCNGWNQLFKGGEADVAQW
jgi:hypothetical protein